MEKILELLLVEDDANDCQEMIHAIENNPDDFSIVGVTNNSTRATQYVEEKQPDVVILDLELHQGAGDGLSFLKDVKDLPFSPFILVTTNNISSVTHRIARELGADFIMTKNQLGYCANKVVEFLKTTKDIILSKKIQKQTEPTELTPTQLDKKIQKKIYNELNKIGISQKSLGYKYLVDAITLVIKEPMPHICTIIGKKYNKTENSVERAMQNAINRTWKYSNIDELYAYYTAKIRSDKGCPTNTEFIYYYAEKIKNEL